MVRTMICAGIDAGAQQYTELRRLIRTRRPAAPGLARRQVRPVERHREGTGAGSAGHGCDFGTEGRGLFASWQLAQRVATTGSAVSCPSKVPRHGDLAVK